MFKKIVKKYNELCPDCNSIFDKKLFYPCFDIEIKTLITPVINEQTPQIAMIMERDSLCNTNIIEANDLTKNN